VLLGCTGCVYEQNEQGTTTTLQMVRPEHMHGLIDMREAARKSLEILRQMQIDDAKRVAAEAAAAKAAAQAGQ
jgi:hypothetical protein